MSEVKILNPITGEVTKLEPKPNDPALIAAMLLDVKMFADQIAKAEKKLKDMAEKIMAENDYKPIPVQAGEYQWVYRAPVTKKYSVITAQQFIDPDLLVASGAIVVATGALKKIVAEQVKDGTAPEGMWHALEASAIESQSKPYVMLERIKR